mmetsp:Transcript_35777/g.80578  ORF Transcript_35777/g.80578 Transcript_35777/m.80578 type:complete len:202 (+) Transcript_35777:973-1578(+)
MPVVLALLLEKGSQPRPQHLRRRDAPERRGGRGRRRGGGGRRGSGAAGGLEAREQVDAQVHVRRNVARLVALGAARRVQHIVDVAHTHRARPSAVVALTRLVVVPGCQAGGVDDGFAVRAHQDVGLAASAPRCTARLAGVVPVALLRLPVVRVPHELLHGPRHLARPQLRPLVLARRPERRVVVRRQEHSQAVRPAAAVVA